MWVADSSAMASAQETIEIEFDPTVADLRRLEISFGGESGISEMNERQGKIPAYGNGFYLLTLALPFVLLFYVLD